MPGEKIDIAKVVAEVMADAEKQKSAEEIAKHRRIDVSLAKQILQIYYTHPGIDVDGILNRMDLRNL